MTMLPDHVVLTDTEYGAVLLDEIGGDYWQLNLTGAIMVRAVLDGASAEQAAQAVADRYQVDMDTATKDVSQLLDQLRVNGLLKG